MEELLGEIQVSVSLKSRHDEGVVEGCVELETPMSMLGIRQFAPSEVRKFATALVEAAAAAETLGSIPLSP